MAALTKQERTAKIGDIVEKVTQMSSLEMFMNIPQMNLPSRIMKQKHCMQ